MALILLAAAGTGCLSTSPEPVAEELREARRGAAEAASGMQLMRQDALGKDDDTVKAGKARPMNGSYLPVVAGPLSLHGACNMALANNLPLRSTYLRRQEAAGVVDEARGEALPQVGLTGDASTVLEERGEDPERYAMGLRITQPLWRSGVISAGLRYARLYAASTDAVIRQQVQDTITTVAGHYLDVLLMRHMVAVYEESLAVAERLLVTARNKRTAGTVSDYEVLRAEVEVSTARADLLNARNRMRTSKIALLQTMGVDQGSEVTLSDTLDYRKESYQDDDLARQALASRSDLLVREAEVEMARAEVDAIRGQYGPEADLFLSGLYADPDPNEGGGDGWNDRWTAGVSLTFTLFDGFIRRGRMAQATARLRQSEARLKDAEQTARVEVVKALLDLRYADELYQSQQKNLELAREALRMLDSGFRLGRNTQIEVLDAQSALTEAMGRYYNAVHAHSTARLQVRRALGILGPAPETVVRPGYQMESDPLAP